MTALAPAQTFPVPAGRGRWRLTLHHRQFDPSVSYSDTIIGEMVNARSRSLTRQINKTAELQFSLDGRDPLAPLVQEFTTDVMGWRWDDRTGHDIVMFRGMVDSSADTITEQADTVAFTAHDYFDFLNRRILTRPSNNTQIDQDTLVANLVAAAKATLSSGSVQSSAGGIILGGGPGAQVSFAPGSYIPLDVDACFPDGGAYRPPSGRLRDRNWAAGQKIGDAIADMAGVLDGFEFDVQPGAQVLGDPVDRLRVFYPYMGVQRDDVPLIYGATVAGLSRNISGSTSSSTDATGYANYWRVIGNNEQTAENAPQQYAEAWTSDVDNVTVIPTGLFMAGDTAQDVTVQSTLNAKAQGNLAATRTATPTYTLTLTPGAYQWGRPNMGDECPLVVKAGRLAVDTYVRVTGIDYKISDDDYEEIALTAGPPQITVGELFTRLDRSIDALSRR